MQYSNPEIPEGINTTKEHPLKEFAILSGGIIGIIVLVVLSLSLLAEMLAPRIPFSMEQELAARFIDKTEIESSEEIYIQSLADTLGRQMTLPEDMSVTLHYVDDNVQNAFATLGGHIYIHRGLLELMPNENALSMVIAHEIAHVQHRHPVIAMGRGVVIGLFLAAITGMNGDRFVGGLVNNAGVITVLGFSREQEREADQTALAAVEKHYGHVSGASDLFKAMLQLEESQILQAPQFFNTHPLSTERIAIIEQYAAENSWSIDAKTTPLSISLENPL
ncbi:MAG: M48 family metalloprotease [Gammaproteobacteria bacterium]|jgi:beta-barrel assembly-enhancing protease|nr:M48 family metalloprotease [Gammaproteobacteria bacterium]